MTVHRVLLTALALALGAAVSLGLARFSYAIILPPMRADLAWTYLTAGAMNTANAAGYLAGALAASALLRRLDARHVFLTGALSASVLLALHAATRSEAVLYTLRFGTGIASALTFVAGGLLAARLASQVATGSRLHSGLILGLYYGGTGLGIVISALAVPAVATFAHPDRWPLAWLLIALVSLLFTAAMTSGTQPSPPAAPGPANGTAVTGRFALGLAAYFCFGLGYIGYMTFIVMLLAQQGYGTRAAAALYALLGAAVMVSPFLWARLLERLRDGTPLSLLNALLALATALPVVWGDPLAVTASVIGFGAVFLSVVASTTALVRHNAPPEAWARGIAAFTVVFAIGQIIGPTLVGWIADQGGGLHGGFAASAIVLATGALLATGQRTRSA